MSNTSIINSTDDQYEAVVTTHGLLMYIAWCVSPFIGIYSARYLKDKWGHNWYRAHAAVMGVLTGVLTLAGFILIVLYFPPPHFPDDTLLHSAHTRIGLSLVILMVLQIILGFFSNFKFDTDRTSVPLWDKLHWWLGRGVFLLGVVNVYLGIEFYEEDYDSIPLMWFMYWSALVIGVGALIYGEATNGKVTHGKVDPAK